ncbi:MAG: T9SS type A sorting domain-containing protein [Hymenobacteraceae bacterium]|nr:T9SS type A sorting domain-containing protein [Hymenobacteraceae bacterium]
MLQFRHLPLAWVLPGFLLLVGALPAAAQSSWDWVTMPVGRSSSYAMASTVDAQGNTIVGGYYSADSSAASLDFGNGVTLPAIGGAAFLAKYDVGGACSWAIRLEGGANAQSPVIRRVTTDAAGNVLVTGVCPDSTRFGAQLLRFPTANPTRERQGFVGKLSAAGTWQWVKGLRDTYIGADGVEPTLLAPDAQGNLYVAGTFYDTLRVDNLRLPAGRWRSAFGAFVARFDSAGRCQWARSPQGWCSVADLTDLKVDAAGDAYLVGVIDHLAVFGTDSLWGRMVSGGAGPGPSVPWSAPADAFVARLNAAGQWRGAYDLGTGGSARLTFGANGVNYVAGDFYEPYEHVFTSATGVDTLLGSGSYVARLGAQGQRLALRTTDKVGLVAVEPDGTIYLAGFSQDSLAFGAYTLPARPERAFYVAGLSPTNQWFGVAEVTNPAVVPGWYPPTYPVDLHVRGATVYVSGNHLGTANFGPVVLTSPGAPAAPRGEFFVARLNTAPLGLPQAAAGAPLTLWPNPAHGFVQVATSTGGLVQVQDAIGRVVHTTHLAPGTSHLRLPLPPGLYTFRCGAATRKLVVQ